MSLGSRYLSSIWRSIVVACVLIIVIIGSDNLELRRAVEGKATVVNSAVAPPPPSSVINFDFDGDGKADVSRHRITSGASNCRYRNSQNGTYSESFLGYSLTPAPADYDDDNKTDCGVFADGAWQYRRSSDSTYQSVAFGQAGDKPVPSDYDGDGIVDLAVYRPSTGQWRVKKSSQGGTEEVTQWGNSTDIAVPGDYDGDGKTDKAFYRGNGEWHILRSSGGSETHYWGTPGDTPVVGDFDGLGKSDLTVFRPIDGNWFIFSLELSSWDIEAWGNWADQPANADYDGDGKDDIAIFRPTTGEWHIIRSSDDGTEYYIQGAPGDIALPSAYTKQVGAGITPSLLTEERLKPRNETGGTNYYSQNFGWQTTLASLPGRAGMDTGLALGYNSLIWTKVGSAIVFDPDKNTVSPGFQLGFPLIEPIHYDPAKKSQGFLMVSNDGTRHQFRQFKASTNLYATDSTYYRLETIGSTDPDSPVENVLLKLHTTDGTTMLFEWLMGAYRCTKVTDRNGNYITPAYNAAGDLISVSDTVGRSLNIAYNPSGYPTTITQNWQNNNGSGGSYSHTWATLSYTTKWVNTAFTIPVIGPPNGAGIGVLDQITYADGHRTKFHYNDYIQVTTIENFAPDQHLLNQTNLTYTPASGNDDCPRLTQTSRVAENFNNGNPVTVTNTAPTSTGYSFQNGQVSGNASQVRVAVTSHPNNLKTDLYFGDSSWLEGLPVASSDCAGSGPVCPVKRWTWNNWTQDSTTLGFRINPRIIETRVGDSSNTRRTTIAYQQFGSSLSRYDLPSEITTFDAAGVNPMKRSNIQYHTGSAYVDRRLIALRTNVQDWGLNDVTFAFEKVNETSYEYDGEPFGLEPNQIITPISHDPAFSSSFVVGRGNLTKVTRHDVTGATSAVERRIRYDIAGSPIATIDPLGRKTTISYADSFNDNVNWRNTFAYPTVLTDANGQSSNVKYRFDLGANVEATSPPPAGQFSGKTSKRTFDILGRLERDSVYVSSAEKYYTRYEFPTNGNISKVYSTLVDVNNSGSPDFADEVLTETHFDGMGRAFRSRSPHTFDGNGNTLTYSGTKATFDILGRVTAQYLPAEIDSNWNLAGTDDTVWRFSTTEYDWKGRPTRTVPAGAPVDGDTLISYEGCGCAGGQITTVQGPSVPRDDQPTINARRVQKVYEDILGRTWKNVSMKWDGTTPYLTTQTYFNGRDQALAITQTDENSVVQTTSMTYDGHGRLKTRHNPIEEGAEQSTWNYNADDTIANVTDPRGAVQSFLYGSPSATEKRPLLLQISYSPPAVQPGYTTIADTPDVFFTYDVLGNRTGMTDGSGSASYVYDPLSRMTSETKNITGAGNYTLSYSYQMAGKLKSITDPFGAVINYNDDKAARTTSITGANFAGQGNYVTGISYRAFGGVKHMSYGSNDNSMISYGYDDALRVSTYQATSTVLSGGFVRKANYEYFADGKAKKVNNLLDPGLDQNYKFDAQGRLTSSISGQKLDNQNQLEEPFTQGISYNAFSDMTARVNHVWGAQTDFTAAYTNGRKTGGNEIYDKAGNVVDKTATSSNYERWKFDASGRNIETVFRWWQAIPAPSIDQTQTIAKTFDGDGLDVKRVDTNNWFHTFPDTGSGTTTSTEYYIRSSVLGGQVLTKLDGNGGKKVTNVYAGKAVLAEQRVISNVSSVFWKHEDPITGSYNKVGSNGQIGGHTDDSPQAVEYEPMGGTVEPVDPQYDLNPASLLQYKFAGDNNRSEMCIWNGGPMPCNALPGVIRNSESTTITVNTRAIGGYDLYNRLSSQVSTWRFNVREVVNNESRRLTRSNYADSRNWHGNNYHLLVGTFYASFFSGFADSVISDSVSAQPATDYSSEACQRNVLAFLQGYAKKELGQLFHAAGTYINPLLEYMQRNSADIREVTFALANAYHETALFNKFTEDESQAKALGYDPKYRGRGYIHLTLEDNYRRMQRYINENYKNLGINAIPMLIQEPDVAAVIPHALTIMTAYFTTRGTYAALNRSDYLAARVTINPNESLTKRIGKGGPTIRERILGLTSGLEAVLRDCR